ncbi:MAG TPA: AI-2E family transporter [Dehalococcoidia bacterium]|nr:AI-2E family transporter [Dehalococcoidia bacterium]
MLKIEVSVRGLLLVASLVLAFFAVKELWPVILLVLVSLILMLGLLPYVDSMVRRGLPRPAAVALLLVAFLATLISLFSLMVPAMVEEFQQVRDNLPESAREIEELLDRFGIEVELQDRARNIDWDELISGRVAFDYGQRILTLTFSIITIVVMTAYLLADTPRLGKFVSQFIPDERAKDADLLFRALTRVVGGYLRGQAITSLCIGIFTFVLLRAVGVPNALAFAVLAGFADIIPLIGALIAIVPPVAAGLQESSTHALIVLAALVAYQQFEDRILVPRVYGRTLNLPPVIVLIAVLAGAELLGVTGVLLALPLTAAGRVGLDYLMQNREILLGAGSGEQVLAPDEPAASTRRVRGRGRGQRAAEAEVSPEV